MTYLSPHIQEWHHKEGFWSNAKSWYICSKLRRYASPLWHLPNGMFKKGPCYCFSRSFRVWLWPRQKISGYIFKTSICDLIRSMSCAWFRSLLYQHISKKVLNCQPSSYQNSSDRDGRWWQDEKLEVEVCDLKKIFCRYVKGWGTLLSCLLI